jgi:hypothetical protein
MAALQVKENPRFPQRGTNQQTTQMQATQGGTPMAVHKGALFGRLPEGRCFAAVLAPRRLAIGGLCPNCVLALGLPLGIS